MWVTSSSLWKLNTWYYDNVQWTVMLKAYGLVSQATLSKQICKLIFPSHFHIHLNVVLFCGLMKNLSNECRQFDNVIQLCHKNTWDHKCMNEYNNRRKLIFMKNMEITFAFDAIPNKNDVASVHRLAEKMLLKVVMSVIVRKCTQNTFYKFCHRYRMLLPNYSTSYFSHSSFCVFFSSALDHRFVMFSFSTFSRA